MFSTNCDCLTLQPKWTLHDLTPSLLCNDTGDIPQFDGQAVAVIRGQCTFTQKAILAQKYGAAGLLLVSSELVCTIIINLKIPF